MNSVSSLSSPGIIILSLALWCSAPAALADCLSESSWFPHSQTPEPGTTGFNSNCKFHQWSWQAFLWLTKEVNGKPLFLSFSSPISLIDDVPYRGMMPRMQKSNTPESFNEFLQAGTDGIMVDQQGRAIYYSQHIDSNFVKFILSNKLTDPAVVRQFNPTTNFPDGTMELKVSWKIVQPGDDVSDMFTMDGEINKLVNKDGKIVVDPNQRDKVKLALVGFHIAGVVEDHPEMIWATFEHKRNAPVVPANATPTTVVSDQAWTFYKANTQYKDCNVNYANTNKLTLDEGTQLLRPSTQACRQFEFGNDPSSTDPNVQQNDANIASLNADVLKHLGEGDVWRNYFEVGAIWFAANDGLKPNMSLATDEILTGSVKLSNATIETYTQTQSTMNNCFRCHNTMQAFPGNPDLAPLPALNINISHAFQNIYFWSQDTTDAQ